MIYSIWMLIAARTLRTRLLIALQILIQNVFKTQKSMSIKVGKMRFLENKRKTCLDEMDGDSVWEVKWCARTCVVEQGWEISILSQ